MSQIINAIPPNALLPVAGALVGWVGHMLWFRSERAHVAAGMARIRQFMRGNDEWLSGQQRRFASAPTDPDVTGEVLAVEPGRTYVVGEDGPVLLALSDRPAADEDEVGDEQPGEAASSIPSRLKAWATDVLDRVHDWLPNLVQQWRERNDVGSGEQAVAVDRFEQFRIDDSPRGRCQPRTDAEIRAELAELTAEPEPVRIEHRYRPAGETGQFPYVKVAGAPRHAAPEPEMPAINQTIPAQRTDGDL